MLLNFSGSEGPLGHSQHGYMSRVGHQYSDATNCHILTPNPKTLSIYPARDDWLLKHFITHDFDKI